MATKRLYAHILLDRSGSMESCRDTAISAFNEYVNSLRSQEKLNARISLTIFDDQSIDLVFDGREAKRMPALTREMFVPRGMTPLNDAIGSTVQAIEKVERHEDEGVAFVILTDGLENASKEYSREAVQKLLERVQREEQWLVIYLGANQDAFAEGATRGVAASHTMDFQPAMLPSVMRAAARRTRVYAENPAAPSDFTPDERRTAMGKK